MTAGRRKYSPGDIRSVHGRARQWEVESLAAETAVRLAEKLAETRSYQHLVALISPEKVALYFEKVLKIEIHPIIRELCALRRYLRNGGHVRVRAVVCPRDAVTSALQEVWPDQGIPLVLQSGAWRSLRAQTERVWARLKSRVRRGLRVLRAVCLAVPVGYRHRSGCGVAVCECNAIALHYAEGIDSNRRCDLFWYFRSGIHPGRVLVYFDSLDASTRRRISEKVLVRIEQMGMRWICLREAVTARLRAPTWRPNPKSARLLGEYRARLALLLTPMTAIESWVAETAGPLLRDIDYWKSFFDEWNIRILVDPGESAGQHGVAQNIAMEFLGGIRVQKQRSELYAPAGDNIGHYAAHVFFAWNGRAARHLSHDRHRINYVIVSGFTNDDAFQRNYPESQMWRERVASNGARFVVALFDNSFGPESPFSAAMVQAFYEPFLKWVLDDLEVGLVIKTKKPWILGALREIHGLLSQAKATGRCVELENPWGRLPSDASQAADMSVGLGISSAIIEAVVAGGRGVHYDPTGLRSHPFYQWGYEKMVFDNLGCLITALRRYKSDPNREPGLGDFSPVMDQLDPFRDGRAGERVGTYLRWLLEAFDKGYDREAAIGEANERYAAAWGADKVVDLKGERAPAPSGAGLTARL